MDTEKMEKYIFNRYKYWVKRQQSLIGSGVASHWEVIEELEILLMELFNYNFPYGNGHYMVIKNEKTIYEYDMGGG